VVLTTYDVVRRDITILAEREFDVAIFDEAQAVKNAAAARTQALAQLRARFRLCLTGTPLENHLGEFYSILESAVPGVFGERKKFLSDHEADVPVLERARPFVLRRTKERILAELETERHAALVFSQFVKALDLVAVALDAAGVPFLRIASASGTASLFSACSCGTPSRKK
jgi:SNF2 family DNA or RNA helicase